MITIEQIRFGNWVKWNNTIIQVNSGTLYNRTYRKILEGRCFGIELTPDLLEQAGFVIREGYEHFALRDIYVKIGWHNSFQVGYELDYDRLVHLQTFKYLHELQNFFFALTTQELQINLHELQTFTRS